MVKENNKHHQNKSKRKVLPFYRFGTTQHYPDCLSQAYENHSTGH